MGLVLSRQRGETVRMVVPPSTVSQEIEVQFVEQRGSKVRLNFTAKPEVKIVRGELGGEHERN
jgi:sRNA-binding carbon storage regulator CsrA